MMERGLNTPPSSSAGRLFDAVAAMLGISFDAASYEGQAAIELEALAAPAMGRAAEGYRGTLVEGDPARLDWTPLWCGILEDLAAGIDAPLIAARFHLGLAETLAETATVARSETRLQDHRVMRRRVPEQAPARKHDRGARRARHRGARALRFSRPETARFRSDRRRLRRRGGFRIPRIRPEDRRPGMRSAHIRGRYKSKRLLRSRTRRKRRSGMTAFTYRAPPTPRRSFSDTRSRADALIFRRTAQRWRARARTCAAPQLCFPCEHKAARACHGSPPNPPAMRRLRDRPWRGARRWRGCRDRL